MKIRTALFGAATAGAMIVATAAPASAGHAAGDTTVALNGANENPTEDAPDAGDRNGSGKITIDFFLDVTPSGDPTPDAPTVAFPGEYYLCYDLVTRNIDEIIGAHIHEVQVEGNPRKLNGPVVVNLLEGDGRVVFKDADGNKTDVSADAATTCVTAGEGVIEDIIEEDPSQYYVNIHTEEFTDGAIRGQLHAFN